MNPPSEPLDDASPAAPEPTICLDQFLKTCGVATGGQAKRLIQGGQVWVNGELETRRRRKLRPNDEVQLGDEVFVVAWEPTEDVDTEDMDTEDVNTEEVDTDEPDSAAGESTSAGPDQGP